MFLEPLYGVRTLWPSTRQFAGRYVFAKLSFMPKCNAVGCAPYKYCFGSPGREYDPVLFGYTYTSCDPRKTPQEELTRYVYEGVLPGFRAETLLVDYLMPWIED